METKEYQRTDEQGFSAPPLDLWPNVDHPATGKGFVSSSVSEGIGLAAITLAAESKTWTYRSPWEIKFDDGRTAITIFDLKFTIIRATIPTGGYRCQMTLNSTWSTGSFGSRGGVLSSRVPLLVELKNSAGGLLLPWNLGPVIAGCRWNKNPVSFQSDFNPDIYDIIATQTVTVKGFTFYNC